MTDSAQKGSTEKKGQALEFIQKKNGFHLEWNEI